MKNFWNRIKSLRDSLNLEILFGPFWFLFKDLLYDLLHITVFSVKFTFKLGFYLLFCVFWTLNLPVMMFQSKITVLNSVQNLVNKIRSINGEISE